MKRGKRKKEIGPGGDGSLMVVYPIDKCHALTDGTLTLTTTKVNSTGLRLERADTELLIANLNYSGTHA